MDKKLQLNKKNTILIGLAFFAILMLWQIYNTYCPLILEELLANRYEDSNKLTYVIGIIMAMDNLAALILMPLFGVLSDKTKTKKGKRMPYILIGMFASALLFPFIATFYLINSLLGVILTMMLVLIIMQGYRSPAVALMPDITPKPLRSKANGIINLVGYIGAILAGALAMVFKKSDGDTQSLIYLWPFLIASIFMLIAMVILYFKVDEVKLLKENQADIEYGEKYSQSLEIVSEQRPLSKKDFKNLIIILIAIFFWFMSFNAIETFNSLFCQKILKDSGIHGTFTIILTVSSIISFLVLAPLSDKIGRKASILIGLIGLIIGLTIIAILAYITPVQTIQKMVWVIYLCTIIIGFSWALVNINSYPMIVEMANKNNIGKFTGYYYSASMIAQTLTPVLIGIIMSFSNSGLRLLYVYSALMMILATLIFIFVKERKNSKEIRKENKSFLERIGEDN
mgnify:CR=1 FL=1